MSEHTPTPWRVKPGTPIIEQFENGLWGLIVADCHMTDEAAANAAFIVKAVNRDQHFDAMVKALEAAEAAYVALCGRVGYDAYQALEDKAVEMRRAILASVGGEKATG